MIDPTSSSAPLDRRTFVRRSAATLLPAWIALAFGCRGASPSSDNSGSGVDGLPAHGQPGPGGTLTHDGGDSPLTPDQGTPLPEDPVAALRSLRSAVDAPPILAIVVPDGPAGVRPEAATLWAGLIREGAKGTILRLGACAMVCARAGDIADALGIELGESRAGDKQLMAVAMGSNRKTSREIRLGTRVESGPRGRQARFPQRKGTPQFGSRREELEAAVNSALDEILHGERVGDPEATRRSLLENAPTGSRWAEDTGCGMRIDGVSKYPEISCGMGHVSPEAAHFLWFLSRG